MAPVLVCLPRRHALRQFYLTRFRAEDLQEQKDEDAYCDRGEDANGLRKRHGDVIEWTRTRDGAPAASKRSFFLHRLRTGRWNWFHGGQDPRQELGHEALVSERKGARLTRSGTRIHCDDAYASSTTDDER